MEIWDGHCHLAGFAGDTPQERMADALTLADRMDVDRLCMFMGTQFAYEPSADKMIADNNEVLEAIAPYPDRAFGFVYLNPQHLEASLAEFERCVVNGPMVAIKLWVAMHADTPEVDAIVERAQQVNAPVFQHTWLKITGNLPGESTPMDVAALAARHPQATIICGHTGGDWEAGIRAIRPYPNVYADLGGGDPTAGYTEMAVRELGAERILFGSDIAGRSYASQLAKVLGANITEEDKALILSDNMRRILAPILETKGIHV